MPALKTFRVVFGVKGAANTFERTYRTLSEAEAKAEQWRSSNSTGDYVAKIHTEN